LEINDHLPNDLEIGYNKWYDSLKFFRNDKEHSLNADIFQLLAILTISVLTLKLIFLIRKLMIIGKLAFSNNILIYR